MLTHVRALLLVILVSLSACVGASPEKSNNKKPLTVLVSIDGLSPDYLSLGDFPTLKGLVQNGAFAKLKPVFPSKTFPNHYSQVTGLYPGQHGIVANTMYDPDTRERFAIHDLKAKQNPEWWRGEPIWVTAKKQGKKSASMFWPGTEAFVQGIKPDYVKDFDSKFSPERRVSRMLQWLEEDPEVEFVILYFEAVDIAGHVNGPDSPEVVKALSETDQHLAVFLAGLDQLGRRADAHIVVVSDHGMAPTTDDGLICLNRLPDKDKSIWSGGSTIYFLWPHNQEIVEQVRAFHPHLKVYSQEEFPDRWRYSGTSRIGPYVLLTDPGYVMRLACGPTPWINRGEHGYDNEHPVMRGVLMAQGPLIKKGKKATMVDAVDIYQLLCLMLGITPAPHEGNPDNVAQLLVEK